MSFTHVGSVAISGNAITGNSSTFNFYGSDSSSLRSLPTPLNTQGQNSSARTSSQTPSERPPTSQGPSSVVNVVSPFAESPNLRTSPTAAHEHRGFQAPLRAPAYQQDSMPFDLSSLNSSLGLSRLTPDRSAQVNETPSAIFWAGDSPNRVTSNVAPFLPPCRPPQLGEMRNPYEHSTECTNPYNMAADSIRQPVPHLYNFPQPGQPSPQFPMASPYKSQHISESPPAQTTHSSTNHNSVVQIPHPQVMGAASITWPLGDRDSVRGGGLRRQHIPVLHTSSSYPYSHDYGCDAVPDGEVPELEATPMPTNFPFSVPEEFRGLYTEDQHWDSY